ncbi:MAG: DNA sulfur modification protein DndD [Actinomycetota bacterium]|nr:DNA sulfur modification protein DndD [Actinomycetota bacterium]
MILDRVVLHDVGVFAGRQQLDLTPPSSAKPIVLVGGLNGAGKTTLLEAIHLALYGALAPTGTRRRGAYDSYLRSLIHHRANPADGASVEVSFHVHREGAACHYRVRRSWRTTGKGLREDVQVYSDGALDQTLSATWAEQVDAFLPRGIAGLFFFDGEQIEALADLERSREVLRAALSSLLGLDMVERLTTDLAVIRRRHAKGRVPDELRQRVESAQRHVAAARAEEEQAVAEVAAARVAAEWAEKQLHQASERYRTAGGELVEERERAERRLGELTADLTRIDDELRELATGPAPLLQVEPLLLDLAGQARAETDAARSKLVVDILAERDAAVIEQLRTARVRASAVAALEQTLAEDRERRQATASDPITGLEAVSGLDALFERGFAEHRRRATTLLGRRQQLISDRESVERLLAAIPDAEAIAPLRDARDAAQHKLLQSQAVLTHTEDRLNALRQERLRAEGDYERAMDAAAQATLSADDDRRLIEHVDRITSTLSTLRVEATRRHLARIADLVLDALQKLLRKDNLITAVAIDPETCTVELSGQDGRALSPSELSAGERQLLAVALLWGLARSTGQPLPVVIDTPLGRLDTSHRGHLLERYFPHASHQVILLSTDTEVDDNALGRLRRSVGHAYRLVHDDTAGATTVERGYFWET